MKRCASGAGLGQLLLVRPEMEMHRVKSHSNRPGEKEDSRDIRSNDFLSSALGFTWQVRRFNLAGCLLD